MDSCDVLVIGGGPAGSAFAWKMQGSGLDVMVLDKSEFPRDKVCAGWVTPSVISALKIDKEEYGRDRVLQPISRFVTGMIGGSEVLTEYNETVSYGIRRSEFDHYLLERSGARLQLGEPIKSLRKEDGQWIVNDKIRTPLLIGAGGHFCPVARYLGAGPSDNQSGIVAQEMEFEMDEVQQNKCKIRPDTPELYFCDDLKGYGWCVRKGKFLNIGLGRNDKKQLSEHVKAFYRSLKLMGKVAEDAPESFKGHAYLLYSRTSRKVAGDGVMLIGDAVGLAYPQSGEGIRPAVESALMAAHVVRSAAGNYHRDRLQRYGEMLQDRFDGGSGGIFNIIPEGLKSMVARRLMTSRWFARNILLDRWFLQIHQQPINKYFERTSL